MIPSFLVAFLLLAQPGASVVERFFVGRTESVGTIDTVMARPHNVRARTTGRMESGGVLVLDQVVEEQGKPARRRIWRLRRDASGAITGTINDARGPVTGEIRGNVIHLRYRSIEGPSVEQWLTLQPGGASVRNRMIFRRFGLRVATVEDVSRRVD